MITVLLNYILVNGPANATILDGHSLLAHAGGGQEWREFGGGGTGGVISLRMVFCNLALATLQREITNTAYDRRL